MGIKDRVEELSEKIGDVITEREVVEPKINSLASRFKGAFKSHPKPIKKKLTITLEGKEEEYVIDVSEEAPIKRVIGIAILFLVLIAVASLLIYMIIWILTAIFDEFGFEMGLIAACSLAALIVGIVAVFFATTTKTSDRKEEEEIAKRLTTYEKDS